MYMYIAQIKYEFHYTSVMFSISLRLNLFILVNIVYRNILKMKLLTFAFVVQFIIACWPKIDIKIK